MRKEIPAISQIWKTLVLVLGGLLLAWLLVILIVDPLPSNDSDLVLPGRQVDSEQNPYPEIRDISLSRDDYNEIFPVTQMLEREKPFDVAFVQKLLKRHATELGRFKVYAEMVDWKQDQPLGQTTNSDFDYASRWFRIAYLKWAQATLFTINGDAESALDEALELLQFGGGLSSADNPLDPVFCASEISEIGALTLVESIDNRVVDSDILAGLAAKLDQPGLLRNDLANVVRAEYTLIAERGMDRATFDRETRPSWEANRITKTPSWLPSRLVYKPNLSRSLCAAYHRAAIRTSEETCQAYFSAIEAVIPEAWEQSLIGNSFGFEMFSQRMLSLRTTHGSFVTRSELALVRLRVAMERYRLEHGDWPQALGSLVPKFLGEIPIDPMDGKSIRFDPKRRLIYSVGLNLVDDGGMAPDMPGTLRSSEEIVIELEPDGRNRSSPRG